MSVLDEAINEVNKVRVFFYVGSDRIRLATPLNCWIFTGLVLKQKTPDTISVESIPRFLR